LTFAWVKLKVAEFTNRKMVTTGSSQILRVKAKDLHLFANGANNPG
jgi:hypothetical protein